MANLFFAGFPWGLIRQRWRGRASILSSIGVRCAFLITACIWLCACGTNYRPRAADFLSAPVSDVNVKTNHGVLSTALSVGAQRDTDSVQSDHELGAAVGGRFRRGNWTWGAASFWDPIFRMGLAGGGAWRQTRLWGGFGFFPLNLEGQPAMGPYLPFLELEQAWGSWRVGLAVDKKLAFLGSGGSNGFVATELKYDPYIEKTAHLGWNAGSNMVVRDLRGRYVLWGGLWGQIRTESE